MAKWGEGDPRWIVEERPDATNVNNWHWSEKDASSWSQGKLKSLLVGLTFDGPEGICQTIEIISCNGEATANNRKGKLIFFYEWNVKLKWKGTLTPEDPPCEDDDSDEDDEDAKGPTEYSGEIEIPNLSEENDPEDIDVMVTSKKSSKEALKLKALVHRLAPKMVQDQVAEYIRSLKEEYSRGLILPRRESQQSTSSEVRDSSVATNRQNSLATNSITLSKSASRSSSSPIGCRIYTSKIVLTESFMTTIEELYNALTTQEMVEAFTRSKATVEAYKGGLYSILNGQISGEFMEVERPTRIMLRWRQSSWPDGHYSVVSIDLKQEATGARLSLLQTEVPEAECERTKEGWKRHIFEAMKSTFGFGAHLF